MKREIGRGVKQTISGWRVMFFTFIVIIAAIIFFGRLIYLQVASHDYYSQMITPKNVKTVAVNTTRGEIYDRNGIKLVSNKVSYNIELNKLLISEGTDNELLLSLFEVLEENGILFEDSLPITNTAPFVYIKGRNDSEQAKKFEKFLIERKLDAKDIEGTKLYEYLYKRYGGKNISDANERLVRKVIGLRYELEVAGFSRSNPYTLFEDADIELLSVISEQSYCLPGVQIVATGERNYVYPGLASHLLGRLGPIYAEEKEEYLANGYKLNSLVGKDGAEKAFEKYLRGTDGQKNITLSEDGTQIIAEETKVESTPGLSVRLTIDANLQKVAEEALYEAILTAQKDEESKKDDIHTGAIVVQDPNTGEILAKASYPTYDHMTYSSEVTSLLNDKSRPLFDRASYGIFSPGSIFKILTAAAALDSGEITAHTRITDLGVYKYFDTYQPHCWVYDKYGYTHGSINVSEAIRDSCNYFFFEVGKDLGIENINEYAQKYGFGVKTGIETGEAVGVLSSPEYSASMGKIWNPGDVIQVAIGQLDNAFTPLQISSFMSALVNGGTRYKTHIFKSADNYYTQDAVYEYEPEAVETIDLSKEHIDVIKNGMKQVTADGTASSVFARTRYSVGGKTGTAQTSGGSTNALFCGFAPFDDPQIVVTVVIENGYKSTTAAAASKKVFDYFYENIYQK